MFELHPQLAKDCIPISRLKLCRVLLMNDANYPWCILVPERPNISEIYQLSHNERGQLGEESAFVAEAMARAFQPDKMNIASLGNKVPQLHIHHIARYKSDPAWPEPIWGKQPPQPYSKSESMRTIALLEAAFDAILDI